MRRRQKHRLIIGILVIASLILSIYSFYANYTSASEKSYTTYVVAPGDTLWAISKKFYPNQRDVLEGVDIICEANGRDGKPLDPIIYPGQVLKIPAKHK